MLKCGIGYYITDSLYAPAGYESCLCVRQFVIVFQLDRL